MTDELTVGHWSHAVTGFGLLGVLFALCAPIDPHKEGVLLIALGVAAIGAGEWMARPLYSRIYQSDGLPTRLVGMRRSRRSTPMVWFADLVGGGFVILGIVWMISRP